MKKSKEPEVQVPDEEAVNILKKHMSVPYCGKTRFDFLDEEEIIMIVNAMVDHTGRYVQKLLKSHTKNT